MREIALFEVTLLYKVEDKIAYLWEKEMQKSKTYSSGYSLVVTDPTTNPPICGLCMAERTGCPVFHSLWPYVLGIHVILHYNNTKSKNPSNSLRLL